LVSECYTVWLSKPYIVSIRIRNTNSNSFSIRYSNSFTKCYCVIYTIDKSISIRLSQSYIVSIKLWVTYKLTIRFVYSDAN
jgi:hypothetical protein